MKKSFVLVSLLFLIVFSACGESGDPQSTPEPTPLETVEVANSQPPATAEPNTQDMVESAPSEVKYTEDNSVIQQLLSAVETVDSIIASFDEENQVLTYIYYFDSSIESIELAATIAPESFNDWFSQVQTIAETAHSALIANGITTVQTRLAVVDENNNPFLIFHDGEEILNLLNISANDTNSSTQTFGTSAEVSLYSDEYIDISYSHCEQSDSFSSSGEYFVVLIVNNKTNQPIVVMDNSIAVDGWNLSDSFAYQEISANSKGYVEIRTEELQSLSPSTISGSLEIYDESSSVWGSRSYDAMFSNVEIS